MNTEVLSYLQILDRDLNTEYARLVNYKKNFILMLHSHVPYVRKAGVWPHGEEMLHEIIVETYLPLLKTFSNLHSQHIDINISLGLTPILLEQLNDKYMQDQCVKYLKTRLKALKKDYKNLTLNSKLLPIDFYEQWYTQALEDYTKNYQKDLINAFKYYQDHSGLDIVTSAASHAYLPLLAEDSSIYGQLKTGIKHYKKYFNRHPSGIWLPECAYRSVTENKLRPIESYLEELDIKYFFTDYHVINSAQAYDQKSKNSQIDPTNFISKYQNKDVIYNQTIKNRSDFQTKQFGEILQDSIYKENGDNVPSTFKAYKVGDSNVVAFGRDQKTSMQVWSADWGYPGDYVYREFHKKAHTSGLQYWQISGKTVELKDKTPYKPQIAIAKVKEHAHHFVHVVNSHLNSYVQSTNQDGIVVSSYDTELFGHWWFEGVIWLEEVIKNFSKTDITMTSGRQYCDTTTNLTHLQLPESSWGANGDHSTWLNSQTENFWPKIHQAEKDMRDLATKFKGANIFQAKILNQLARELVILQASDWPFLISTGQAEDYAKERFDNHILRFNLLKESLLTKRKLTATEQKLFTIDNPFTDIDYRDFSI